MPFDGFMTRAITHELSNTLIGGRVDKIYQPKYDQMTISVRNKGDNHVLYINCNGSQARIHLLKEKLENPQEPPLLCMILRKHLIGGVIQDITQLENDRIVRIDVDNTNELGYRVKKIIYIEIMGKYSNLILTDEDHNIIDAMKKITHDQNAVREILPGVNYDPTVIMNQKNPFTHREELPQDSRSSTWRTIIKYFMGFSPAISKSICIKANLDPSRPYETLTNVELENLHKELNHFLTVMGKHEYQPQLFYEQDKLKDFYIYDIKQYELSPTKTMETTSELVEYFYRSKQAHERFSQRGGSLLKDLEQKVERTDFKLSKLQRELRDAEEREKYKVYADLISSHLHEIDNHQSKVTLPNFFEEGMPMLEIPLDSKKTAVENAQHYYKTYTKKKSASKMIRRQIIKTKNDLKYLQSVVHALKMAESNQDIDDIREELRDSGFLRQQRKKKKKKKKKNPWLEFKSPSGFKILCGKNNRQNAEITFKVSHRDDLWFHVKDYPGSHVILRSHDGNPSEDDILYAGQIAATYSSVSQGKNIAVDYTERRNVKKIPGAQPGMVNYSDFKTVHVDPIEKDKEA